MRAVRGHDYVRGRDVAVDDPARVKGADRLAKLDHNLQRVFLVKMPAGGDHLLEILSGDVVAHHNELSGHLVGRLDAWQAGRVALSERRPHAAARQLGGDALPNERAGPVQGHELRCATGTAGQHALHMICVVYAHGMHDLLIVQFSAIRSSPTLTANNSKGYIQSWTDSSVRN